MAQERGLARQALGVLSARMVTAQEVPLVSAAAVAVPHARVGISSKITGMLTANPVQLPTISPALVPSDVKCARGASTATREVTCGMRAADVQVVRQVSIVLALDGLAAVIALLGSGQMAEKVHATHAQQESTRPAVDASPTLADTTVDRAALDTPHVPVGVTQQVPSPKPTTAPCAPAGGMALEQGAPQSVMDVLCVLPAHGQAAV